MSKFVSASGVTIVSVHVHSYRIIYQDVDIKINRPLLIELLLARNFKCANFPTTIPNKTHVLQLLMGVRIPSDRHGSFDHASMSGLGHGEGIGSD